MKALVLRNRQAVIEDRPVPKPGPTAVVVRTTVASICSADVDAVAGNVDVADGTILGHEAVGVLHEIGSQVRGFQVGQRVAVMGATPCGRCENCQRGHNGHCGGAAWGAYSSGLTRDGSLAEYFVVPDAEFNLAAIPDGVSDALAVCATDTLTTGATGPEQARIPLGGTVAVFGQGHIGLGATVAARALGAGLIVTVKARPGIEPISRAMGADHTLNWGTDEPLEAIRDLTGGQGVDCAIEATGTIDAFPSAVAATRLGGVIAVLSSYSGPPSASLPIPLADWGWGLGDKTIVSTFARGGSERVSRILRLIDTDRIDPAPLLTHRYRFSEAPQALADLKARRPGLVKPLISFASLASVPG